MEGLEAGGDFAAAEATLRHEFDRVIAFADAGEKDLFRDAAFALRLARQLAAADPAAARRLLPILRDNERLATTLVFLVREKSEKPEPIYDLLFRLHRKYGEKLGPFANLAAAVCVVHDRPLTDRINENRARAPDPLAIFDYFSTNERHMLFGIRNVPPELLIHVVDTTASTDEMAWALRKYRGDPVVGDRFFDIKYDFEHFRDGDPKRVTVAGFSLPNILRYGGVCVDQAYYAATVGKSIGVPTARAAGRSSKVGHSWVGFLQTRGQQAWWNFDVGRYPEYQGVKGNVRDPQTRQPIPDSHVSLLAELIGSSARDRHAAAAFIDAARRLLELAESGDPLPSSDPAAETPVRDVSVESTLQLVEHALRTAPGYTPGWAVVRNLAAGRRLTLEQTKRWAAVLDRLCGNRYPDFYLATIRPMIGSVEDVGEQNNLWNKAFALFGERADLAASVRMTQGRMWEAAGEPFNAGQCYEDVIYRYTNAGPFVISALKAAEKLLAGAGQGQRILALYDRAFRSIKRPPDMAGPFYRQSNYYRVGKLYAEWLDRGGRRLQAAGVRSQIGMR